MSRLVRSYIKDKALPRVAWFIQRMVTGGGDPTRPELEAVYQRIFERDLQQVGATNRFYPVRSAANYGLLYFLLRVARETEPSSILDLGAGQTSLLFDELRQCGVLKANITTVEHDQTWADYVKARVSHEVRLVGLKHYEDGDLSYDGYDFGDVELHPTIDLLVVDGPPATTREQQYARHCCLELLDRLDPAGFVIVVDDAHRSGEALLCDVIARKLRLRQIAFTRGQVVANKRQTVFASGQFSHTAFY
jgi:hypothetical protein